MFQNTAKCIQNYKTICNCKGKEIRYYIPFLNEEKCDISNESSTM